MNRKDLELTIKIVLLAVLSLACALVSTKYPAASTPSPSATVTLLPTNTPVPTQKVKILPTVSPGQLMDEVYLAGGFGGWGGSLDPCAYDYAGMPILPPAGVTLPAMDTGFRDDFFSDQLKLCIYGIPQDQIVHIALYDPQGKLVSEANVDMKEGGIRHIPDGAVDYGSLGKSYMVEGVPVMELNLWWPNGMMKGEWKFAFDNGDMHYDGKFVSNDRVGVSITPEHVDPFNLAQRLKDGDQFVSGDIAYVFGGGFEANTETPLGFYLDTGMKKENTFNTILEISRTMLIQTDEYGSFAFEILIDESYLPGTYYTAANLPAMNKFARFLEGSTTFADISSSFTIP